MKGCVKSALRGCVSITGGTSGNGIKLNEAYNSLMKRLLRTAVGEIKHFFASIKEPYCTWESEKER